MSCLNGKAVPTILATPRYVRLGVPELGFGTELDAMVPFCRERGEELRNRYFRTISDHRDWLTSPSAVAGMRKTSQGASGWRAAGGGDRAVLAPIERARYLACGRWPYVPRLAWQVAAGRMRDLRLRASVCISAMTCGESMGDEENVTGERGVVF
jgi:hypothetical protein